MRANTHVCARACAKEKEIPKYHMMYEEKERKLQAIRNQYAWTHLCCLRCRVRDLRTSSTRVHRPWQQDPVRASAWSQLFSRQMTKREEGKRKIRTHNIAGVLVVARIVDRYIKKCILHYHFWRYITIPFMCQLRTLTIPLMSVDVWKIDPLLSRLRPWGRIVCFVHRVPQVIQVWTLLGRLLDW